MLTCMTVVCIGISHQELAISHVQSLLLCILNSGTGIDADCLPPSDTPDPTALSPQALNDLLIGSSSVLSPAQAMGEKPCATATEAEPRTKITCKAD